MPLGLAFTTQDPGQADSDPDAQQLPTYDRLSAQPPAYDPPPSYKDIIFDEDGRPVRIGIRFYPAPDHVRLSPLEVCILRDGNQLPFMVGIPNRDMEGNGVRAALKWVFYRYVGLMLVEVTNENVDDYGRWIVGSRPRILDGGVLQGRKHFMVGRWVIRRKSPAF